MKKYLTLIMMTLIISVTYCTPVLAGNGTCGYKGCSRSTKNCHNGTVYCDTHAAAYAREKGYKTCAASGCYDYVKKGSSYCSGHTCSDSKCNNKAAGSSRLCSTHKCKYSGCSSHAYYTSGKYMGYCNSYAWQLSGEPSRSKSTTKTSNKTKSNKSKKTYEMPDCDDYDSYEDFMDDWDGCMPDGSDAEDYWENW